MPTYSYRAYTEALKTEQDVVSKAVEVIRKNVELHGPRLVQQEIDTIIPKPVDRGTYRRSWHTAKIKGGATLYNSALHAAIIEEGRRAGSRMPPVSLIYDWLRRKKIVSFPKRTRRANRERALRSAAFVIARAIARRGLPALHILAIASRELDEIISKEIVKEVSGATPVEGSHGK